MDFSTSGGNSFNDYMAIWRDILSLFMWIGAIWWIAAKFLGIHHTGDPGAAIDDAGEGFGH